MLNQFGELFSGGLLALSTLLFQGGSGGLVGPNRRLGGQTGGDEIAACRFGSRLEDALPNALGPGLRPGGSRLPVALPGLNGQGDDEGDDDEDGDEDGGNAHDSLLRNLFSLRQKGQPSALFSKTLSEKLVLI